MWFELAMMSFVGLAAMALSKLSVDVLISWRCGFLRAF
jgi:hypothetical protein